MNTPNQTTDIKNNGFSLIELLSIVAITSLIGFSAPKLLSQINNAEQMTAISEFSKAISFANQQAVSLKTTLAFCAANEKQTQCSETKNNWRNGYLIQIARTGEILKALPALPANIQLISADSRKIIFSSDGLIISSRLFKFCDDRDGSIRNVIMNSGREVRAANFTYDGDCTS